MAGFATSWSTDQELRVKAFELVLADMGRRGLSAQADLARVDAVFKYLKEGTLPATEADRLVPTS